MKLITILIGCSDKKRIELPRNGTFQKPLVKEAKSDYNFSHWIIGNEWLETGHVSQRKLRGTAMKESDNKDDNSIIQTVPVVISFLSRHSNTFDAALHCSWYTVDFSSVLTVAVIYPWFRRTTVIGGLYEYITIHYYFLLPYKNDFRSCVWCSYARTYQLFSLLACFN